MKQIYLTVPVFFCAAVTSAWADVVTRMDVRPGTEYYIYNTYYNKVLGGDETNANPKLSTWCTNDSASYVFVAEPSSLTNGYYWLRQKSTGKYLQASNADGNTWSVWFAGSLNAAYSSYEWKLEAGTSGSIVSHRGETNNGSSSCHLGVDPNAESSTYVGVYYDKPVSERTVFQLIEAKQDVPFDSARLNLYKEELQEVIVRGEEVYQNDVYGAQADKAELATALYNARSAVETASLLQLDLMNDARVALSAAIDNAVEGKYVIWVSGSSFKMGNAFTVALNGVTLNAEMNGAAEMVLRNASKTGAVVTVAKGSVRIGETVIAVANEEGAHDYTFAFDGKELTLYFDGEKAGAAPQQAVPACTSVGSSAEWTIMGQEMFTTYEPLIVSSSAAVSPTERPLNANGKYQLEALKMVGQNRVIDEAVDFHISSSTPMEDSKINLKNEDAWVIFDNVRPSTVISKYLKNIKVNGLSAVNNTNVRVVIYLQGTAVIPHSKTYKPFQGFTGELYSGDEYKFGTGRATLAKAANNLQSFILKRGYMVCLATNADGSGYSRVYVADHEDKRIDVLPDLLNHRVSYINVRKWNYVSKKGWCNTSGTTSINTEGACLGTTWFYTWSADRSTQTDMEYVPMKPHLYWPDWASLNQTNSTCALGLNEPDHSEQHGSAQCSCGGVIDSWKACTQTPNFFSSGLRIGSPSPTDAQYLTDYIKHCNDMGYRVDFVGFHAYWGTNEAANADAWKSRLQSIYNNTKRPIWLTEWNNGASWTTESWPSSYGDKLTKQKNAIKDILKVLDESDFIERYSIYNWDSYYRAMISWDSDKNSWWVTPAGQVYRDDHPTFAYKEKMQFVPIGWFPGLKTDIAFNFKLDADKMQFVPSVTDPNGDFTEVLSYEYKQADGTFAPLFTETDRSAYDKTTERTVYVKKDDLLCPNEAFDNGTLTVRATIKTLNGKTATSPEVTVDVPELWRSEFVGISDVNAVAGQGVVRVYRTDGQYVGTYDLRTTKLNEVLPAGAYLVKDKKVMVR